MITRAKNNIHKPLHKMNLHIQLTKSHDLEPTTMTQALKDSQWRQAMSVEYDALVKNGTWELVPLDPSHNLIGCKWIFRTKRKSNGFVEMFKARLVAKGFHQRSIINYTDTFSPVVKATTILVVLSFVVSCGWFLRQLDVNNAFLQGNLFENVYMSQPPGFVDQDHLTHICRLRKAIYGLKQAPRAWYQELHTFILSFGFKNSDANASLFVFNVDGHILYFLVYVDDIIIMGNNPAWWIDL